MTFKKKKLPKFRFRVTPVTYRNTIISYNFSPINRSPQPLSFATKTVLTKQLFLWVASALLFLLGSWPATSSLPQDLEDFRFFLDHPLLLTSWVKIPNLFL